MNEKKIINKIKSYETEMKNLSNEDFKKKTKELQDKVQHSNKYNKTIKEILPYSFALVKEAAKRVLGFDAYDVQLLGGIVLTRGEIAEMKTGEGKTLVAIFPAYIEALSGKGVHIVTVNDYLAKRDSEEMGKVFNLLGLTCGCILHDMQGADRKIQYSYDITYVTNNEIGFDYLRDNMVTSIEQKVLRGLNYCIIDEADSILIDEARTPLIISAPSEASTAIYSLCDILAKQMTRGKNIEDISKIDILSGILPEEDGDFAVDLKAKNAVLTSSGIKKVENSFHLTNLAAPENAKIYHCMLTALKANYLFKKDKDYIVRNQEILIVDEFTGRVMEGRRYSDGLHQALEAKERVNVKQESKTLAEITFQNFFNKYEKKGGMTGTAYTERKEFHEVYNMDVVKIPTNKPVLRKDLNDKIFITKEEKFNAVCERIEKAHIQKQPVLVGTGSVQDSEKLGQMISKRGISCSILNAKNNEREAEIISHAGEAGKVTISTNMAGRGTDIKLNEAAKEAGGLLVIGMQRYESRRVDDQLRGRSGRQGDIGESQFYISLDDDLFKTYATEKTKKLFKTINSINGEAIENKLLSKSIENVQKMATDNNFGIRKSLMDFDVVNNEQRETIYEKRDKILNTPDDTNPQYLKSILNFLSNNDLEKIREEVHQPDLTKDELLKIYEGKTELFSKTIGMTSLEKIILLKAIDKNWQNEIDNLAALKQMVGGLSYGQKDPVTEYKIRAFKLFQEMMNRISIDAVLYLIAARPA